MLIANMWHYVYKISYGGRFYIGVRSSHCPPELDSYYGSGGFVDSSGKFLVQKKYLKKEILATCVTRIQAQEREYSELKKVRGDSGCLNRSFKKHGIRSDLECMRTYCEVPLPELPNAGRVD